MIRPVKAKLLEAKRGLIVGIANEQSIAWGCAKALARLEQSWLSPISTTRPRNSSSRSRANSNHQS
jgi:enoyl-[acyl-carrier-protein] reductase (NADH)